MRPKKGRAGQCAPSVFGPRGARVGAPQMPLARGSATEPIVHADAGDPHRILLIKPLDGWAAVLDGKRRIECGVVVCELQIQRLRLDADIRRQCPFCSHTCSPSPPGVTRAKGLRDKGSTSKVCHGPRAIHLGPCQTTSREQEQAIDYDTGAGSECSERIDRRW